MTDKNDDDLDFEEIEEINDEPSEEEKENQSAQKAGALAGRAAADYFTDGKYEQVRNTPVVGDIAKQAEGEVGKVVGEVDKKTGGQIGKIAKKADDIGALDAADKGLSLVGGGTGQGGMQPNTTNAGTNLSSGQNPTQNLSQNSAQNIQNSPSPKKDLPNTQSSLNSVSKPNVNSSSKSELNKNSSDDSEKVKQSTSKQGKISPKGGKLGLIKQVWDNRKEIMQNINPANVIKKFDVKKIITEAAKKKLKKILITAVILLFIVVIGAFIIFSPILQVMEWMEVHWDEVANVSERYNNLYLGFGLETTKEAFYDELDYLYEDYDKQLDIPLLMATLFYNERDGYDSSNFSALEEGADEDLASAITNTLKTKYRDLYEDLDTDGKNYTVGKIYRLRKLAKHQMELDVPTDTEEVTLSEYIERSKERLSDDTYQLFKAMPEAMTDLVGWQSFFKKFYAIMTIKDGDENLETTSLTNSTIIDRMKRLFKEVIVTDVELATLKYDDGFKVTILKYEYDEDNYKDYLKEHYIRTMPEFKKYLENLNDTARESEIDYIIKDIYEYAQEYKDIFGYERNANSEDDSDECIGNVNSGLIEKINLPIKESESYNFTGSDAYGISNGTTNNGVDLTSNSAGVKAGDDVYAIAKGKVVEVVYDLDCNTSTDSTCPENGNYIVLSHTIKTDDGTTFKVKSIYANLQKNSNKFKVGDTIKKGNVIGKIGQTGNASEAKLHFELHDTKNGETALNPTNIFNKCPDPEDSGEFLVHETCLTKTEFVSKLKDACSKVTCSGNLAGLKNIFIPNAETIYDTSKKYNINPELIVVRAINEGFSPGSSRNNYWGIGCTNTGGLSACKSYSSLKNGIKGFANLTIVKNATTVDEMMSSYAYIGSYWYNPGGSGVGGCYYYPYIKQYMKPSRSAKVAAACSSGKACNGSSCTKTTDEDQKAYTKWQVDQNLTPYREKIFGTTCSGKKSSSSTSVSVKGQTNAKGKSNKEKIKIVFPDGVPKNESQAKKYIVDVEVPITTKSGKKTTTTVQVHRAVKNDVVAALKAAQKEGFRVYEIGGFGRWNGSSCDTAGSNKDVGLKFSQHCYGLAVDINVNENCYKKPPSAPCSVGSLYSPNSNRYSITKSGALYKSFIGNGWGWGGDWNSLKDYMHFSFFGT